jgi:hypothetical protein
VGNFTYVDPSLTLCEAAYPMEPTLGKYTDVLVCCFGCVG